MARWNTKRNHEVVLEELDRRFSLNEKGQVTSSSIVAGNIFNVLTSLFQFKSQIPEHLKNKILTHAFYEAKKSGKVNAQALQKHIAMGEEKHLRLPLKKYHIVTTISLAQKVKVPVKIIDGVRISITPDLPIKYLKARQEILKIITSSEYDAHGLRYQYVVVTVSGKTKNEAVDIALDKLDFVRSLWNYYFNSAQPWRISFDEHKAVNRIKLGPYHSLHKPDGGLATEDWWYEKNYNEPSSSHISKNKYDKALEYSNRALTKIKHLKYRNELENYLVNYGRALDTDDLHSSFLKLWVALEQITGTTFQTKKTDRAARIYSNFKFSLEIVNYLRDFRDKAVHHNSSSEDIETIIYHLKSIVEDHLKYLIKNSYHFDSVEDYREFLDLPMALDDISKNQKQCKKKIKRLEQIKHFRRLVD